ncbi:MAG: DUF2946 domain-containing protein [Burkholderiaceae bacterium]
MFCWIAALAVLVHALLPSLGEALAAPSAGKVLFVEICSLHGVQSIALPLTKGQGKTDPNGGSVPHCAFCAMHAHGLALPPQDIAFALPNPATFFPRLFLDASAPLFAWIAPPSRGPPARRPS